MKFYLWVAAAGALAIGFVIYTYYVYDVGRATERARLAAKVEEMRENQKQLVEKLEAAHAKERIVVKERIKIVRAAADDGCLDKRIPDSVLNQLH